MDIIYRLLEKIRPETDFKASKNFIEDGLLDSFDVVSLSSEIEEEFDILIDALDILPENFYSAEAIFVIVKKNGGKL